MCTVGGAGTGGISDYHCFGYQFSDIYRLEHCTLFERVRCGCGSFAIVWGKDMSHILSTSLVYKSIEGCNRQIDCRLELVVFLFLGFGISILSQVWRYGVVSAQKVPHESLAVAALFLF